MIKIKNRSKRPKTLKVIVLPFYTANISPLCDILRSTESLVLNFKKNV